MSLALIVVHFVLPFLGLMSRHVKRLLPLFGFWSVWLLAAHAFDLFWLIMPNTFGRLMLEADGTLPEAFKTSWNRSNRSINSANRRHSWTIS